MSGTIILIDGVAGCGKTTVLCGMPGPRAILDTDVDGSRWLREHFEYYESQRDIQGAKRLLTQWSDNPKIASIAVDVWAYFWQQVAMQVIDGGGNTFRAWGPAKMSIKKLYDPLMRAKKAGKHICLTAHTKEDLKQGEDKQVEKMGLKADSEAMLNDLLDVHLRMTWNVRADTRRFETVKCRPQRDWKPLLPRAIEIPREQSHLMYPQLLALIGESPAVIANGDSESEDVAAQAAMKQAAQAAGGR
jgi:hypothetical protein